MLLVIRVMGRVLANCKLLINPVDLQHEGSYSSALVRGICPARGPFGPKRDAPTWCSLAMTTLIS